MNTNNVICLPVLTAVQMITEDNLVSPVLVQYSRNLLLCVILFGANITTIEKKLTETFNLVNLQFQGWIVKLSHESDSLLALIIS